jgi:hypothetical protein
MLRATVFSFAVASLVAVPGCEKTATNVPEAPMEEEADWAPPEDFEEEGEQDEEEAPNLSRRRNDDEA